MNSLNISLSDLYSHYKDWVRRNPQTASEVETTFKWLSYFIAGKINKSVVLTELVYSASNLLVLFNDIIIHSEKQKLGSSADKIKIWLTVLEYSEVFIEISSKHFWGHKGKWIIIVCVQLLKCAAKLVLLLNYKEKIISSPPILPCKRNQERIEGGGKTGDGLPRINNIAFSLKRSGRVIRKVDSAPPLNNRLWKPPSLSTYNNNVDEEPDKALLQQHLIGECTKKWCSVIFLTLSCYNNNVDAKPDKALLQQHLIGEVLYIVKPIVNLMVMMKYGRSTWKPWSVSAAMDLISLYLLVSKPKNQVSIKFSQSQRLELSRRRLALLLYLMRSPFYERHSKDRVNAFLDSLSRNIPLAKLICSPLQQYLPHWQETYFYLWSS